MPPPTKKSGGKVALIIGLVVVLLLCPCLGLLGWGLVSLGDEEPEAGPSATATAEPTGEPTDEPSSAPSPTRSTGSTQFAKGDCVVNDGTDSDAELRKVPCGPNTYEVLLRIPATSDGQQCKTLAPESDVNYTHDDPLDVFDFVLCLKER